MTISATGRGASLDRARAHSRTGTLTRRQLIRAAGGSAGSAALAAAGFSSGNRLATAAFQIDGTPPVAPVPTPAGPVGETVEDRAALLDYDAVKIFRFVADEIHYEPYAGILRGARGTLWARAGNSADQAVLLGELLAASQIPHRFAIGALTPEHAGAFAPLLAPTAEAVTKPYQDAVLAATLHIAGLTELPDAPPDLPAEDQAAFDNLEFLGNQAVDLAADSASISGAAIADALAGAGIALPDLAAPDLPDRELNRHVWIQTPDGPDWLDLDPTLPEATYGTSPIEPVETVNALPEDWYHSVKVSIAADEHYSGSLSRREVVSLQMASPLTLDVPIALSIASANELAGIGLSINQAFTGQKTLFPTIYADGTTTDATAPMIFATEGASAIGLLDDAAPIVGAGEGETVAVWLVIDIASPDAGPVTVERALLDRIPVADRASGVITPENIAPITVVPGDLGDDTITEFNSLTVIQVDVGRIPATYALARSAVDDVFGEIGVLGPSLASLRDGLGLRHETEAGYWSFPSAPNLTAFTISPGAEDASGPAAGATVSADLLHRQRTSLPLADAQRAEGAIHPLVLSGVLDAAAERLLLDPRMRGESGNTSSLIPDPSIGAIFEVARASGIDTVVLSTPDELSRIETSDASSLLITRALEAGSVVVFPGQPVDLGGTPLSGWWIIDPLTGRTTDQLGNGKSFASIGVTSPGDSGRFVEGGEYSFLTRAIIWITENVKILNCVGNIIGQVAIFACLFLASSRAQIAVIMLGGVGQTARAAAACSAV